MEIPWVKCRADALRWIPAFAGMTVAFLTGGKFKPLHIGHNFVYRDKVTNCKMTFTNEDIMASLTPEQINSFKPDDVKVAIVIRRSSTQDQNRDTYKQRADIAIENSSTCPIDQILLSCDFRYIGDKEAPPVRQQALTAPSRVISKGIVEINKSNVCEDFPISSSKFPNLVKINFGIASCTTPSSGRSNGSKDGDFLIGHPREMAALPSNLFNGNSQIQNLIDTEKLVCFGNDMPKITEMLEAASRKILVPPGRSLTEIIGLHKR